MVGHKPWKAVPLLDKNTSFHGLQSTNQPATNGPKRGAGLFPTSTTP